MRNTLRYGYLRRMHRVCCVRPSRTTRRKHTHTHTKKKTETRAKRTRAVSQDGTRCSGTMYCRLPTCESHPSHALQPVALCGDDNGHGELPHRSTHEHMQIHASRSSSSSSRLIPASGWTSNGKKKLRNKTTIGKKNLTTTITVQNDKAIQWWTRYKATRYEAVEIGELRLSCPLPFLYNKAPESRQGAIQGGRVLAHHYAALNRLHHFIITYCILL